MTVTTLTVAKAYLGNGANDDFPVDFQFWDHDELEVWVRTTATGALVQQVKDTDYTVTGGAGSTGNINTAVRSARIQATETIHILRVSEQDQQVDLTPAVDFPSASVEEVIDRQALRLQESFDRTNNRAMVIPLTDMDTSGDLPDMSLPDKATRASKYLSFDANGEPTMTSAQAPDTATISSLGEDLIDETTTAGMRGVIEAVHNRGSADELEAGTIASRPAAATFGDGFFFATDERVLYYSDSSAWTAVTIGQFANGSIPAFAKANRIYVDTDQKVFLRDDGAAVVPMQAPWARGTIGGLTLSRAGATTLGIAVGDARCVLGSTGAINASLTSSWTKTLSNFDLGTGVGGVVDGADPITGPAWHYVFLISADDGTVDICIDDNPTGSNISGDGVISDAANNLDENFRRIGAIYIDASNQIEAFTQHGDHFIWDEIKDDYADGGTADYTAAAGVDRTMIYAPPNSLMQGWYEVGSSTADYSHVRATGVTSETATAGSGPWDVRLSTNDVDKQHIRFQTEVDSSGQVNFKSTTDTTVTIAVYCEGYWDSRDKDA